MVNVFGEGVAWMIKADLLASCEQCLLNHYQVLLSTHYLGYRSAIESLIEAKFEPTRTLVLGFGFDEEASGHQGAGHLGPYLESTYGENGFAMVVDEGSGIVEQFGSVVATPAIAEKGFLNVLVEVSAPGGHSSIPPTHTVGFSVPNSTRTLTNRLYICEQSIGILSALLVHYERHPTEVKIVRVFLWFSEISLIY